jgi:hypothetical protein
VRKKKMMRLAVTQAQAQAEAQAQRDWQRQEQALDAEMLRVLESGTPQEAVLAQALSNVARPFAKAALGRDENVRREAIVRYQIMPGNFTTTYLMVTDQGLIWNVMETFETAVSLRYADVVNVSHGEGGIGDQVVQGLEITYRPADFPTELRRYNPTGELDATFLFPPETDEARSSIVARCGYPGPHDEYETERMIERLRAASTDVTTWTSCPICCHDLDQATPSVMHCLSVDGSGKHHYFSAPDIEPVIDESDENFGAVVGQERWMPLLESELELAGIPLIWMSWRDRPFGAPKILDYETIRAVWVNQ